MQYPFTYYFVWGVSDFEERVRCGGVCVRSAENDSGPKKMKRLIAVTIRTKANVFTRPIRFPIEAWTSALF
jgi:hypothetical protein